MDTPSTPHTARIIPRRPGPKKSNSLPWLIDQISEDEVRRFSYNELQVALKKGLNGSLDDRPDLRKETVERCTDIIAHAIDAVIEIKSAADVRGYLEDNTLYGVMKSQNDSPQHILYVQLMNDERLTDVQKDSIESALKAGLDFAQARLAQVTGRRVSPENPRR